jgi:hypothetical protein
MLKAGTSHPLAQATLLDKVLFQTAKLLVEQIVRLVNVGPSFPMLRIHRMLPIISHRIA